MKCETYKGESKLYEKKATQNYGREGGSIIIDCCTNALLGSFSPLSNGAEEVSKALGNQTVQIGSISNSTNHMADLDSSHSQSLQMTQSPLMTADQIKNMPDDQWILTKTRTHPMLTTLKRFDQWGIKLDCPYSIPENDARTVQYASKDELKHAVQEKHSTSTCNLESLFQTVPETKKAGTVQRPDDY